jgi:hypothetical protein
VENAFLKPCLTASVLLLPTRAEVSARFNMRCKRSVMPDALINTQMGQYHLIELIRHGGMASIYQAYQASLERFVAVKVLRCLPGATGGLAQWCGSWLAAAEGRDLRRENILSLAP